MLVVGAGNRVKEGAGQLAPFLMERQMFRQNTYTQGNWNNVVPVFRKAVAPGESVDLHLRTKWETPPFFRNVLGGGVVDLYAFYVPHRLVWSGWIDFIADAQAGTSVPSTTTAWPQMFEHAGASRPVSVLARRSYKLIYNQFFGTEAFAATWYSDIATDTDVSMLQTRTLDQFNGHLMPDSEVPDPVYNATVTAGVAAIPLMDFRNAMRNARSNRRSDMTGDKYVDALARMGVQLDWRVQMAPEFLGKATREFEPIDTKMSNPGTGPGDATGTSRSKFMGTIDLQTGRKFFAEHGLIIGVMVVRPWTFYEASGNSPIPADGFGVRQNFFLGDNMEGAENVTNSQLWAGVTGSSKSPRFAGYLYGQNLMGNYGTTPLTDVFTAMATAPTTFAALSYPNWSGGGGTNVAAVFPNQTFAAMTRAAAKLQSPIKPNHF